MPLLFLLMINVIHIFKNQIHTKKHNGYTQQIAAVNQCFRILLLKHTSKVLKLEVFLNVSLGFLLYGAPSACFHFVK